MAAEVVDLFCGCGGLSLGAHQAGLRTSVAIDVDVNLSSAFGRNFPRSTVLNADISELRPAELKKRLSLRRPLALIGGPPCQGFSVMGRRDRRDPRNKLLRNFFEYVAYFRPSFFLMENVPGLAHPSSRPDLDAAMAVLPGRYTCLEPMLLDAADFGAATSRPRLVVVGYDSEYVDRISETDFHRAKVRSVSDVRAAIWDLPKISLDRGNEEWLKYRRLGSLHPYAEKLRAAPPRGLGDVTVQEMRQRGYVSGCQQTYHSSEVVKRFSSLKPGDRDAVSKYPKLRWDKPAHVLRAGTGVDKGSFQAARPIHPDEPRVITVREAARIQGFPDWFQFHPTKWHSHRMIGNSVSPIFAKAILKVVMDRAADMPSLQAAD
ncbi:DNA cytosine methyltransferase [Parvibaculum sp.]|uniref:DNA cytosine methyltransferase n=1 Tax=Parvibaculum sp. TaxID=2024848 RepID=UPI003BA8F13D